MAKPYLVVFTGAGISEESGVKTFRDAGGLWEKHNLMDVASISGWSRNPALVLEFYNHRRRQLHHVTPNSAHIDLALAEDFFDIQIITQNVDDLHERGGSSNILHLHGELLYVRSTGPSHEIIFWPGDLNLGDSDTLGYQLRPHIVWFGEEVPLMSEAAEMTRAASAFLIIGTSLAVYPAASLLFEVQPNVPIWYVDPYPASCPEQVKVIQSKASIGTKIALGEIRDYF